MTVPRTLRLDEVAEVTAGNPAPQEQTDFCIDGAPFVRMQDVGRTHWTKSLTATTDRLTQEAVARHRLRRFLRGTLLIPKSGASVNLNHRALLGTDAYVVSHLATVIPDATQLDAEYLYYWSLTYDPRHQAQTTSLPSLPTALIKAARLPVPSMPEQRRIVDLLSRAEGIVRLRREAQHKASELIPAIFIDMFGDPATNPDAWPRHPLSALAEVISGVAKGRKLEPAEAVELPYMRVANVKDGYLDLTEVKTIEIKRSEVEKLLIRPGDLLMTEGGDPDKLGRAALWNGELEACVHQNHVFKVRSDDARLSPAYLRALAGSPYGKAYFLSVAKKTTGIASINKTQLSAFPVPLPPLPLQRTFERRVMAVESILSQQVDAAEKAKASFQSLLSSAFGA
jgi:type I restriction enzyme S subunit